MVKLAETWIKSTEQLFFIPPVIKSVCEHCNGSGAVKVGEFEYQECPCVKDEQTVL